MPHTDDNTGEQLIMYSDKKVYRSLGENDAYFNISNTTGSQEVVDLQFIFPKTEGTIKYIEQYEDGQWHRMKFLSEGVPLDDPSIAKAVQARKPIPDTLAPKARIKFAMAPRGRLDFRVRMQYPSETAGEFYTEAFGTAGGYGLLDPWYDSFTENQPSVRKLFPLTKNERGVVRGIPLDELINAIDVQDNQFLGTEGQFRAKINFGETYLDFGSGDFIRQTLNNAQTVAGIASREQIHYTEVLPGVDLHAALYNKALKENLIVKNKDALNPISWMIESNVSYYLQDGNIIFIKNQSEELARMLPPVATDANGKVYALKWSLDNGHLTIGNIGILSNATYPVDIDPSYTVNTGTLPRSLDTNGARKLARKSNGDLWAVYTRSDGTQSQIYAAYSTDGGQNWNEDQAVSACSGAATCADHPTIAIDSADNIDVAWHEFVSPTNYIKFRQKTTSWQTEEEVVSGTARYNHPAIAVYSDDNVGLIYTGNGVSAAGWLYFNKRTGGSWGGQETVAGTGTGEWQFGPSIAIDSSDNVHAVWSGDGFGGTPSTPDIVYRMRTTSWQPVETVTDRATRQEYPSIALDSSDQPHVVWYGLSWGTNTTIQNIQYSTRSGGSWLATPEGVTDSASTQASASIGFDASNNVQVVWAGQGWGTNTGTRNIQYREKSGGTWQDQVGITDNATGHSTPILIWAAHPIVSGAKTNRPKTGYAFLYTETTTLIYYASDNLTWDTPSTPLPTIDVNRGVQVNGGVKVMGGVKINP